MAKSTYKEAVDTIQRALRPSLMEKGFRVRGRTFNRATEDGLTQVVNLQMGTSGPPGTTYIPGLRENLYGLFTINLGVYVPEVAKFHGGGEAESWVQDYHCCVRARLGDACGEEKDIWWHARAQEDVIDDLHRRLASSGIPFLERFSSRDKILAEWNGRGENVGTSNPPRIVLAIILAERGRQDDARKLLALQVLETKNPRHPEYVHKLAAELGLGALNG